ncbi:hypothetical protein HNQ77_005185 [Silvibacterium bohemicum]|uniref:Uncharacterized protein n=1 Tax=Silvibacterium bohemicum TaxID=1577686 RepID=A0A841K7W2_9BACT|nr:hypothetical protein [Silvibacterium bohemicum]MBB6147191.1 hypothetical protein [Silvibacterium bohemicum]
MDKAFEPASRNEERRQAEWRKHLVLSRSFSRCTPLPWAHGECECVYWDTHVTAASDPERNVYRKGYRRRYLNWVKAFCESLDTDVDNALTKLSREGQCIPCLGRMIYECLVVEVEAPYAALLSTLPGLPNTRVTLNLEAPTDRAAIEARDSMRSGAIAALVISVKKMCERAYLKELVKVLNHGRKQNAAHQHLKFGRLHFNLITTEFTVSMLKQRAQTGTYKRAFQALTKNRPMDQWGNMDFLL